MKKLRLDVEDLIRKIIDENKELLKRLGDEE